MVGAREIVYVLALALATLTCPAFLLLDLRTSWREASSTSEGVVRLGTYLLAPHSFVTLCLMRRFRSAQRWLISLAAAQFFADFISCFALALVLLNRVSLAHTQSMAAIGFGYALTALSFVCFLGPLAVRRVFDLADSERSRRRLCRCTLLVLCGVCLAAGLAIVVLVYALLFCRVDILCNGVFGIGQRSCGSYGTCRHAACQCDLGAFGDNCDIFIPCLSTRPLSSLPDINCTVPAVATLCVKDRIVQYQCAEAYELGGEPRDPFNSRCDLRCKNRHILFREHAV